MDVRKARRGAVRDGVRKEARGRREAVWSDVAGRTKGDFKIEGGPKPNSCI